MKLGSITIGQSPRLDVIPEMKKYLGHNVEILEIGALDNLSNDEINSLYPKDNEYILVSKLNNGSYATFSKESILPRLKECIKYLENENVDLILFLCTGEFPNVFKSKVPIIYPDNILKSILPIIVKDSKLGVLTPEREQINQTYDKWLDLIPNTKVIDFSPYTKNQDINNEVRTLVLNSDFILLDCMGYSEKTKSELLKINDSSSIICSRTLIARILSEFLNTI